MVKKARKPNKTKKSKPLPTNVDRPYNEPRSVSVRKASNGFVVSSYGRGGETLKIAKNENEVSKFTKELLEMK